MSRLRFVGCGVAPAVLVPLLLAPIGGQRDASGAGVSGAGLIGNQASLRSVHPVSRSEARGAEFLAGSRVLRLADGRLRFVPQGKSRDIYRPAGGPEPAAAAAAEADRDWLESGVVPGKTETEREMATRALLDMRTLTRPNGAAVVAWYPHWRFVWPRDASWICAAFAATGHPQEAYRILGSLARAQEDNGTWEARYDPVDATPVRDGRQWQLDANGWVPWAVWFWWSNVEHTPRNRARLGELWPMVVAAADYAAKSLDHRGLPPPSPDYWEIGTRKPNLGTAAPLLAGLHAAADLAGELDDEVRARRWGRAATRLAAGIEEHFAAHYSRTIDPSSGADAAVTFLGPPFAPYDAEVDAAIQRAGDVLTTENGGVIPGESWPGSRSESWTAESGWFALAAAGAGRDADASHWLGWIAGHRTSLGAIPEKVGPDGAPVSVAPFAWADAIVLLGLLARDSELPVPPVPKQ